MIHEGKEIKLKHTLKDDAKKNMIGKEGKDITITSTYPRTVKDVATITVTDAKCTEATTKAVEATKTK